MTFNSTNLEKINRIEQFLEECSGWRRLLEFFRQENSYLKTRLSMMLDRNTDTDFLTLAEQYQSLFLLKDEFFTEILQDVKRHEEALKMIIQKKMWAEDITEKKQKKLRNEIEFLEKDFAKMKDEFNKQLLLVL